MYKNIDTYHIQSFASVEQMCGSLGIQPFLPQLYLDVICIHKFDKVISLSNLWHKKPYLNHVLNAGILADAWRPSCLFAPVPLYSSSGKSLPWAIQLVSPGPRRASTSLTCQPMWKQEGLACETELYLWDASQTRKGLIDSPALSLEGMIRNIEHVNRRLRSEGKRKNLGIQPGFEPRTFWILVRRSY